LGRRFSSRTVAPSRAAGPSRAILGGIEPPRAPTPAPERHRWTDAYIVAYLVVQVAVPLTYYLGLHAPTDERFSWRMFSETRLERCDVTAVETVEDGASTVTRAVSLPETLQEAWISELKRKQPRVVARFLERACEDARVVDVKYVRRCRATDGTEAPPDEVVRGCRP